MKSSQRARSSRSLAAELPRVLGIVESLLQTLPLLIPRDMQENLGDACSLVGEQALELTDVVRPALPDRFGDQAGYPYRDGLLVVRAVEDADLAPGRTECMHAPQVVMSKLGRGRLLEGDDPAALRVHPRQDMTDRPVLPRRIEPLQHEQQRSP